MRFAQGWSRRAIPRSRRVRRIAFAEPPCSVRAVASRLPPCALRVPSLRGLTAVHAMSPSSPRAPSWVATALLHPVYDVRRLAIDFVASPRHADGLIVSGSVALKLDTAVRRTVEAIPAPRVVIAVGACAASGGIVGEGYASAGGVDRVL